MSNIVRNIALPIILAAFALFVRMPAMAQEIDAAALGVTELAPIIVTSGRVEQELLSSPMSVSVVGSEEITDKPKTDIQEYLRDVPGVHVSQTQYGKYTFSIRGYDNNRVALLIDGVRQRRAGTLLSEQSGGIEIDPADIERIEVIKGPASALYGSDAIGGVINIITKKGGRKPFSFTLGTSYDTSVSAFTHRASAAGKVDSGWDYRVSASRIKAHDRHLPDNEKLHYSDYERENYTASLGYNWDMGRISLSADHYSGSGKMPTTEGREQMELYGHNYLEFTKDERTTVSTALTLDNLTKNLNQVSLNLYYQDIRSDLNSVGDASDYILATTAYPFVYGKDENRSFGGSFQTNWTFFDSHKLIAGIDYEYSTMRNRGDYVGLQADRGNILDEDRKGYSQDIALFAQDEWSFLDSLALTLGIRYTHNTIELTNDETFPEREGKETDSNVVGNIGLVYRGIDNLALRAIYSQGYRSPSLKDKFMGNTQRFKPNPSLKPEKSNNYEIGARYYDGQLTFDITGFYSTLKDAFANMTTDIPHPAGRYYMQVQNVEKAKSFGMEANASYRIEPLNLTPYGSMTWMRYQHEHTTGIKTYDTGRPEMWGTFGLKWDKNFWEDKLFYADVSMTMSDGFKTMNADGTYDDDKFRSGKQLNLALGLKGGKEHEYQVALNLRNILDDKYEPDGYFQPGFHAIVSFSFTW